MKRSGVGLVVGLLWLLVACGSGPPEVSFRSIAISATGSNVRLGATQQFSAAALDASGSPVVPQPSFTWSSSSPSVVMVDPTSGLATAVGDGTANITARASQISSNAVTLVVRGTLEASGGTINRGGGVLGTFVAYKLRDSSGKAPSGSFQLSLSGPPGWNGGQALSLSPSRASSADLLFLNAVAPVSGTYTLFANLGGQILSSSFGLEASQQIAQSLSVRVTNPSPATVNTGWDWVIGAGGYVPRLVTTSGTVVGEATTSSNGHSFTPSPPLGALPHYVALYALSANLSGPDPALPAQVNASRQVSPSFTPAGSAAAGSISGTVSIGGAEGKVDGIGLAALEPGGHVPGEVIVKFRPGLSLQSLSALQVNGVGLQRVRDLGPEGVTLYRAPVDGAALQGTLEALNRRADVEYAQPNFIYHPSQTTTPNDPSYASQWHYPAINLPQAWTLERGLTNPVTVAVIDTGIFAAHPDLSGKLVSGYDFVSDPLNAGDGNGRDGNPEDNGSAATSFFHGTHVAGTIAAATNNSLGVAGVSWGARVLPVRALGLAGGTTSDITAGMLWAAGVTLPNIPPNPNPAQVINMSLGGQRPCRQDPLYQDTINQVLAKGVAVVVSAGNSAANTAEFSPASCSGVITVGASNPLTQRAYYSNHGPRIDLMAPGGSTLVGQGGVLSTLRTDGGQASYTQYQGTSMAAPHVAGVMALMKSARPSLGTAEALDILERTARAFSATQCSGEQGVSNGGRTPPPNLSGGDCGAGLINAFAAVQAAQATPTPGFAVRPSVSGIGVGAGGNSSTTVNLERWGGFGSPISLSVAGLPAGVTASFTPNPASATATLRFSAATTAAPGIYNLTLNATGGAQSRSALFTLVVGVLPANLTLNGAKIAARFWNGRETVAANSRETALSTNANIAAYTVSGLAAGNYYLEGWIDVNRNGEQDDPDYFGYHQVGGTQALAIPPASGVNFQLFPSLDFSSQGLLRQTLSELLTRLSTDSPDYLSEEPLR